MQEENKKKKKHDTFISSIYLFILLHPFSGS